VHRILVAYDGSDDARRAYLLRKLRYLGGGAAPPKHQRHAIRGQRVRQGFQAMMQPPALRTADPPVARILIVENVAADDWPFAGRCSQSSLIGETQILSKPNEAGLGRISHGRSIRKLGVGMRQPFAKSDERPLLVTATLDSRSG